MSLSCLFHQYYCKLSACLDLSVEFLAHLVMAAVNKKAFEPSLKAIKDKYYAMFRGQSSGEAEAEAESGGERAVSPTREVPMRE